MRLWAVAGLVAASVVSMSAGQAPARPAPVRTQVADGVYLFRTAPYGEVGMDGNAVVIVSTDGVLVFDSNGTPAAAEAVLREIRAITDQPVRYVVNSHWHWDHWYGTEVYRRAFPDVRVVAHEKTRQMMMGPALAFNQPGLDTQLPGYIEMLEKQLAAMPDSPEAAALRERIAAHRWFLDQKRGVRHTFPDVTFTDALTIHLGDREVQVRHRERAVTPGDAFLYLPKERILVTGDLLVNPISFALSVYPNGWVKTLEWMDALDAAIIVPGHGEVLRDETLLHATLDIFRRLIAHGRDARARGLSAFAASDEVYPLLREPMVVLTGDDPGRNGAFRSQLVEWFMHRVYDELDGPLSDAIAPVPVRRQGAEATDLRVLFIGNSLTSMHDVPGLVEQLTSAGGARVRASTVARNDFSLDDHWQDGEARRAIARGGWSVVVLQQGPSALPESRVQLRASVARFAEAIRRVGARPALYMVWPSAARTADFDRVRESYALAAADVDGLFIPAGEAWRAAWRRDDTLALYGADGFHPTPEASYLAALVIAGAITGRVPPALAGPVPADRARLLHAAAADVLR